MSGAAPEASLTLSLSYINALDVGKRSRCAAIGLLFYDHLISVDREVALLWQRDKSRPAFWLYLFNRLFPLAYYIWNAIPMTPSGRVGANMCIIYLMCDAIVTTVSTIVMQVILQLRIYALYERNKKLLIFLLVLCTLQVGAMATLIGVTMSQLKRVPIISTPTGCAYQGLLPVSTLFWVPGLIFEPILFLLVAWKAWGPDSTFPHIPLVRKIAQGSLLYFVAVFGELLVNTVVWAHAPQYINIVNPWSAAIPSLLGSRLMLGMLEAAYKRGDPASYIIESFTKPRNSLGVRNSRTLLEPPPERHSDSETEDDEDDADEY